MRAIGFSIGVLYWSNLSLLEKLRLFKTAGATAVELNVPEGEFYSLDLTPELISLLNGFDFVSLHALDKLHGKSLQRFIEKMDQLCVHINISAITIHPELDSDFAFFETLVKSGLPFSVENMDSHKRIGLDAAFFSSLTKNHRIHTVLDVQHCYEHDHTMILASQLAKVMSGSLSHMHVSGQQQSNNHSPLFCSENKGVVLPLLKFLPDVPIILEGSVEGSSLPAMLTNELSCVKIALGL